MFTINVENLKTIKYHTSLKKHFSIICSNCGNKYQKIFTGKESIKVFKILDLIIL